MHPEVLYHEPYGGAIDSGIASCFHRSPGPAAGWALEVVDVQLQSCTHECALWVDFVAEVAVDYVRRRDLTCSFSEYLRGCALPVCVCVCVHACDKADRCRAAPAGVRRSPRSTACGGLARR